MSDESDVVTVSFKKNGDLYKVVKGEPDVLIGHYDRKTGHLEFETVQDSVKLIRQVTAAIGSKEKGTLTSGLVINTMSVKGRERDKPTGKVPPKPKRNPNLGDQTPALVEWYFKYYPQEAYIRYGVYLEDDGTPVRRTVRRKITELVDDREGNIGIMDQNEGKGTRVGKNKWENGPVTQTNEIQQLDDQIIARRATHMTFSPNEVVGGFDSGDGEESGEGQEREEVESND